MKGLLRLARLAQNAAEQPVENERGRGRADRAGGAPAGSPAAGLATGLPHTQRTLRPRAGRGSLC